MIEYWLVLIFATGAASVPPVHVGNFKSQEACLAAAKSAQTYKHDPEASTARPVFMCIQANESGLNPPH